MRGPMLRTTLVMASRWKAKLNWMLLGRDYNMRTAYDGGTNHSHNSSSSNSKSTIRIKAGGRSSKYSHMRP